MLYVWGQTHELDNLNGRHMTTFTISGRHSLSASHAIVSVITSLYTRWQHLTVYYSGPATAQYMVCRGSIKSVLNYALLPHVFAFVCVCVV